jgi:hypothetical protein
LPCGHGERERVEIQKGGLLGRGHVKSVRERGLNPG